MSLVNSFFFIKEFWVIFYIMIYIVIIYNKIVIRLIIWIIGICVCNIIELWYFLFYILEFGFLLKVVIFIVKIN